MKKFHYGRQDPSHFEVLGDRYMVRVLDPGDNVVGGIVIPDQGEAKRGWVVGEIVRVGNGHRLESDTTVPMFFKVGDTVFVERLTGKDFKLASGEYRILSQIDVLAKVTE
jgi:co-chaperonin GroES (HSP10)